MATLLDAVQQNSSQMAGQQQGVTDQTSNLQGLLRAKSGKQVTGGDVAQSNLGEQQAVSQTNNQMRNQVAPEAAVANQQMQQQQQGLQQQYGTQQAQIAQSRKFNTLQTQLQTNSLLQQFEQGKGQISLDQDKAAANQIATNLRLSNQQYTDQLQIAGQENRLDNQASFQQQLAQQMLGDNQQLLEQKLGDQSVLDINNRQFSQAMAGMDINMAYDVFSNEMANQQKRAIYSGAGAVTTAGVAGYGTYAKSQAATSATPTASTDEATSDLGGAANNDTYQQTS